MRIYAVLFDSKENHSTIEILDNDPVWEEGNSVILNEGGKLSRYLISQIERIIMKQGDSADIVVNYFLRRDTNAN